MNQGRIEQVDEPSKIYGCPRNRFVADFIGTCNILDAQVLGIEDDHLRLRIAGLGEVQALGSDHVRPGVRGALALRPEQVAISLQLTPNPNENHFRGQVFDSLYLGDVTVYVVELANGNRIEAMLPNSVPGRVKFFEPGDAVEIGWRVEAGRFLAD
jgi:spermidine/putrescine transport system ATP-binding protein